MRGIKEHPGFEDFEEDDLGTKETEAAEVDLAEMEGLPLDDSVRMWLREIGKIPLLTMAEEISLAKRIEAGDDEAKAILTEANLRLVVSIAKRYSGRGMKLSRPDSGRQYRPDPCGREFDYRKGTSLALTLRGGSGRRLLAP